jgi:GNAT superfamily N-acetyltransferase
MTDGIHIRLCEEADIPHLAQLAQDGHHQTEPDYFETAYKEQCEAFRIVFLAVVNGHLAGYVHLNFRPLYTPFVRLAIPEIQDLFVHPDFRRQGIGEHLIAACEGHTRAMGKSDIGIGVGVVGDFGAAQRLYTRLGYRPDGAGAVFERVPVKTGEVRPLDDRLCLMLLKNL